MLYTLPRNTEECRVMGSMSKYEDGPAVTLRLQIDKNAE